MIFLNNADLALLPPGKILIDENNVFCNHFSYLTGENKQVNFENHKRHWDLHIPISGVECIALSPTELLCEISYQEEDDSQELSGSAVSTIRLSTREFALLLPGEGHIPKLAWGNPNEVNKLVVKIACR